MSSMGWRGGKTTTQGCGLEGSFETDELEGCLYVLTLIDSFRGKRKGRDLTGGRRFPESTAFSDLKLRL